MNTAIQDTMTDKIMLKRNMTQQGENFYIYIYKQEGLLIKEQHIPDPNPLFIIVQVRQQHGTGTQTI